MVGIIRLKTEVFTQAATQLKENEMKRLGHPKAWEEDALFAIKKQSYSLMHRQDNTYPLGKVTTMQIDQSLQIGQCLSTTLAQRLR